ncbi:pantetheine-phosphate adenylyltransferase [Facilibium subflavum]|uniref:pantetheine-phosphate adenylyltransferase n=1 Tax=Facilibium subflavum TaxID=2219058 RepID=UPI000E6518EE|nr:pantetheine-phosphate adenylyltransferase [Facilibium subflavum]
MTKVVYPGTFDPISYGHIDLVKRALCLFDHVIVAISTGTNKQTFFDVHERFSITKEVFHEYQRVTVIQFEGLLVDLVDQHKAKAVIRGLRAVSDFEYEFQMASINHHLNKNVETIFLTPDEKYTYLSSTMIREVARIDPERVAEFVSPVVLEALKKKILVDKK